MNAWAIGAMRIPELHFQRPLWLWVLLLLPLLLLLKASHPAFHFFTIINHFIFYEQAESL